MIKRLYPVLLLIVVFLVWKWRQSEVRQYVEFTGKTMGPVVYSIKYYQPDGINYQMQIDSVLNLFNECLNTYRPNSEISIFNKGESITFQLPYFYPVLEGSRYVFEKTDGAFDPTIMPLVNAWGFGPDKQDLPDSTEVDSLRSIVDFELIKYDAKGVSKLKDGVSLDFSAIAKGYGVDVVGDFLESNGVVDYFVEIGGEILAKGVNAEGNPWRVGIINPVGDVFNRQLFASIDLRDKAIATSANNYNYIIDGGKRYVHTISPQTGYPIEHSLLSASVIADDCMTADAFATAFMVVGVKKAIEITKTEALIDVFLIYEDAEGNLQTYGSEGLDIILSSYKESK
jgi:thiamine biosynthesis lipoprotein